MKKFLTLLSISLTTSATTAFAHPGHDVASGAMAGFMHPLTGLDHLIALVCVGALLAGASPRERWQGVASLVGALMAGAVLGLTGLVLPATEWVIALSVLVAGVLLLRSTNERPALLVPGIAVFALFHGYAHGVEASGQAIAYVAAFLITSCVIVGAAIAVFLLLARPKASRMLLGAGATVAGMTFLALLAT